MSLTIRELNDSQAGTDAREVVIALSPAFGTALRRSIIDIDLGDVLQELCAGIEEEDMVFRFIKVYNSTDLSIIASQASALSGSGISIGVQSRGTTVIHQRDMVPLDNLELFPQSPLYTRDIFRKIGRNAARYAKGGSPQPVEVLNDYMAPSKYLIRSTLMHLKEGECMNKDKKAVDLQISFD